MKRKRTIIGVTLLLIFILLAATLFGKHVQEKKVIQEREEIHKQYEQAANHIHMDLDESVYERTGDPKDLVLTPTNMTFALLERWKTISECYPEINYPEKLINLGDWIQVSNILGKQSFIMDEVSIKIGGKYTDNPNESMNPKSVYDYIYYNDSSEDYFLEFLEDRSKD